MVPHREARVPREEVRYIDCRPNPEFLEARFWTACSVAALTVIQRAASLRLSADRFPTLHAILSQPLGRFGLFAIRHDQRHPALSERVTPPELLRQSIDNTPST